MTTDHQASLLADLDHLTSASDLCKDWKEKYRGIAVAAQSVLSFLFPAGAKVLGVLISMADSVCSKP